MIGFYNYTVVLTYLSLLSAGTGILVSLSGNGHPYWGVFFLLLCGLFDAFDGQVARTKKNRTQEEKSFGIQLDSLCDVICFGAFPALICYLLGVRGSLGLILVFFYCTCAVIRLAFFNVMEEKRQQTEGGGNKIYRGLPVTSISFILPLAFWLQFILPEFVFLILLHLILLVVGFLFILDFPLRKPTLKELLILIGLVSLTVGMIIAYTRFRLPDYKDRSNPILEEIIDEIEDET